MDPNETSTPNQPTSHIPRPGFVGRHTSTEVAHGTEGSTETTVRRKRKDEVDLSAAQLIDNLEELDKEVAEAAMQVLYNNGLYDLAEKIRTGKKDAKAPAGFMNTMSRVGNHRITVTDVVVFAVVTGVLWIIYEGIAYGLDFPRLGLFGDDEKPVRATAR